MRLRNISNGPVYESMTSSEITTGKTTTEIHDLKNLLNKILDDTRFEPILSEEEQKKMDLLKERSEIAKKRIVEDLQGYDDPYGLKKMIKERHEHAVALQKARVERILEKQKKKDGFKDLDISNKVEDLVPKKIAGKPKSLKEILQHNAAVEKGQENG